ncbi:hypothetical protein TRVL_10083 [Trypanosoma vivax]|nr:hypothetical protein TRVL_10083 [Trypanosoma vivax]
MRAMRAFVEKYGQASFSFNYRTRADVGVAHADSFLRLYNGDLLFFENNQAKFMGLQNAMVSFELPKGGDFIRAFGATKECFQNERRALEESRPALLQQCEAVRSQIHEERQNMQAAFAAADGENSGLGQRICQLREQDQHMLEHAKGLQDANEVLAAEDGLSKAGGIKQPWKREARARKGASPTPSCRSSVRTRFFTRPQPANSSSSRKITIR